jgi:hypothetical protein
LGAGAHSGALTAAGIITLGADAVAPPASTSATVTLGLDAYATGYLPAELGGRTLVPGTYNAATTATATALTGLTGILTLEANDVPNPVWTFIIGGGALTTVAASEMKIIHLGSASAAIVD